MLIIVDGIHGPEWELDRAGKAPSPERKRRLLKGAAIRIKPMGDLQGQTDQAH